MTADGRKHSGKTRHRQAAIVALITTGSIEAASTAANISPRTMHRYLADQSFANEYREAKARMLDGALNRLRSASLQAVEVLVEISNDIAAASSARVSAAKAIVELSLRAGAIEEIESRLSAMEAMTIEGER
jgi:hypothetical protein